MRVLETKEITVPGYEGSKVIMLKKAPWGAFSDIKPGISEVEMATILLPAIIKGWNFDDEDGKPLEISKENIRRLPMEVVLYLLEQTVANSSLKKKTSGESVTSSKESQSE
ncbi:hypothetical protein LCGC14_0418020 [marine sediment metagenome]|uniref:Uncharacterized protein n=1 Tax=marine sediment metagenome TaxID=412755 RepID=A0A0F9VDT1_9ZZZZ